MRRRSSIADSLKGVLPTKRPSFAGASEVASQIAGNASALLAQFTKRRGSTAAAPVRPSTTLLVGEKEVTLYWDTDATGRAKPPMYYNAPDDERYARVWAGVADGWCIYRITDRDTGAYDASVPYDLVVDQDGDVIARAIGVDTKAAVEQASRVRGESTDSDSDNSGSNVQAPPVPFEFRLPNGESKWLEHRIEVTDGAESWVHTHKGVDYGITGSQDDPYLVRLDDVAAEPQQYRFKDDGNLYDANGCPAVARRPTRAAAV